MENFVPNQAISGNDFQIDKVDEITFHNLENCIANNTDDYVGIQVRSGVNGGTVNPNYEINVHQNSFINATPLTSLSQYVGIAVLEGRANVEISSNNFTNMFHSMSLVGSDNNRIYTIESNEINVTRRASLRERGESQIVVIGAPKVNVFDNTISCSADAPPLAAVFPNPTNYQGVVAQLQSAIQFVGVGNNAGSTLIGLNWGLVRENTITGFEVGIAAENGRVRIHDNKIKSHYYGIFMELEGVQQNNNTLGQIQCNEIEMDLERNTTSVGIGVYYNDITSRTDDIFAIIGNCILNSTRAIEVIGLPCAMTGTICKEKTRLPNILNNYLYNYIEAGIVINGDFESIHTGGPTPPSIGGNSGNHPSPFRDGSNTFISNNELNGVFDIHYTPFDPLAPQLEAYNNDFGLLGIPAGAFINSNVQLFQASVQHPSFAKCSNQAGNMSNVASNLGSGGIYQCGDEIIATSDPIFILGKATNGDLILTSTYQQTLQELGQENPSGNSVLELSQNALKLLTNQTEKDALYTMLINGALLNNNQNAWLTVTYQKEKGAYALAKQALQNISNPSDDAADLVYLEGLKLDLLLAKRSVFELMDSEIQALKLMDDRGGKHAAEARKLVHATIGRHPFIFTPYPLSQPLDVSNRQSIDLTANMLDIYPNPTKDEINIEFVVNENKDNMEVVQKVISKERRMKVLQKH